jgi:hypothetical protein
VPKVESRHRAGRTPSRYGREHNAEFTTNSRSAITGPSNFWMYSSGTPVMAATSCADIGSDQWAWISRGASLPRSRIGSSGAVSTAYLVDGDAVLGYRRRMRRGSAPFSTPMTLRSCILNASRGHFLGPSVARSSPKSREYPGRAASCTEVRIHGHLAAVCCSQTNDANYGAD